MVRKNSLSLLLERREDAKRIGVAREISREYEQTPSKKMQTLSEAIREMEVAT